MSDIYTELQPVATELLEEFKQGTIALVSITEGSGPADEPGDPVETIHALSATVKGVSFKHVQSGFALESDLMVTSAVLNEVTISGKDFITIDGVRHKIVKDMSVPAAGIKIAWKFIVRKGG